MLKERKESVLVIAILLGILLVVFLVSYFFIFSDEKIAPDAPLNKDLLVAEGEAGFTDIEGNEVTLADYFGNVLVVTSWASWCPQCATDLPLLTQLAQDYSNSGVQVLAVNRAENRYSAERFLDSLQLEDGMKIILDPEDHFFIAHEGFAMPETILYDKKGNIVLHQRGQLHLDELRIALEELTR